MKKARIKLEVNAQGDIRIVTVKNVGHACESVANNLMTQLGGVVDEASRARTPDFYIAPVAGQDITIGT